VAMNTAPFGVPGEWWQVAIAGRAADNLMGDIGVCFCGPDNRHAELGFSLAREFHGQGLATEAVRTMIELLFEHTPIARVVAMTDERNQRCIRLLERLDLKRVSRVNSVFRGEPCVECVYVKERGT